MKVKSVIMADIEQLINFIVTRKPLMRHGEGVCIIEEISNLIRRIDHARENGLDINFSNKERLGLHKSELLKDQRKEELENKKLESPVKARINESITSAPPISLQQVKGFSNWLSYISQAKDVLMNISN